MVANGDGGAPRVSKKDFNSLINRFQAPEQWVQQAFAINTNPILPGRINLTRPLESLKIVFRGRVVVGTANYTAVAAEAPQTIIQRIRLTGTHRQWNQVIPIDVSGATAFAWGRIFQSRGSTMLFGTTRQTDPGVPFAQTLANFGNTGTYDLEIHYNVPLGPMFAPSSRPGLVPYFYYPEDWADTLTLQLFFGDNTSFGTPAGGTTVTFTAFGSGAGTPTVTVYANYCILGPLAKKVRGAVIIRNEQPVSGAVTAIGNSIRMLQLQKNRTTNILVKSGILLTGSGPGIEVYASLSDVLLDRTQVLLDNKPIRANQSNPTMKEYGGWMFNTIVPQGYLPLSFVESMNPLTMFRGDLTPGGADWFLVSDVLTASANNAVRVVQEQMLGEPGGR
jgi:hypothetical protein